jgi:hypothetical protein
LPEDISYLEVLREAINAAPAQAQEAPPVQVQPESDEAEPEFVNDFLPEDVIDMIRTKREEYMIRATGPRYQVLTRYHDRLEEYLFQHSKQAVIAMIQNDLCRSSVVDNDMMTEMIGWISFLEALRQAIYAAPDQAQEAPPVQAQPEPDNEEESDDEDLPDELRCPISHSRMKDPVQTVDGQAYDRASIVQWFNGGHRTSPASGLTLTNFNLVPNLILRNMLISWCRDHGKPAPVFDHSLAPAAAALSRREPTFDHTAMVLRTGFMTRLPTLTLENFWKEEGFLCMCYHLKLQRHH